jgi:hypothetical protein
MDCRCKVISGFQREILISLIEFAPAMMSPRQKLETTDRRCPTKKNDRCPEGTQVVDLNQIVRGRASD